MRFTRFGALAIVAVMAVGACTQTGAPSPSGSTAASGGGGASGGTKGTVKVGVDLPLSGASVANGEPTRKGIELAVKEANDAGGVGGYTVELNVQDDAVNGVPTPQQGATNVTNLVADAAVVGMVGPFNSGVARAEIPITNAAGLAQCSPANTGVDLTKEGSEQYRPERPDDRNYFRVASTDDLQGPAVAQLAYNDLGKRVAYIVDDTTAFGKGVGDTIGEEFERLGGTIARRDGNDYEANKDFTALLTEAFGLNPRPDVVFFAGTQTLGGGQIRKDMGKLGFLDVPLVGPDGIADLAAGGGEGAFITLAGVENSDNVYGTTAGLTEIPDPEAFRTKYREAFNEDPGAYSALAYACTQVLLQAIDASGDSADMAALREAVRAYVFEGNAFETVLGEITFDENGDSSQKWISFHKTNPELNDGKGGWEYIRQQDYGEEAG
jgi:branched-chain amino acid transport system substrate-binding protein